MSIIITITNILIIHSCFIVMLIFSVGFGNVASETDNEKIFSILMMIVAGTNDYDDDDDDYDDDCGIFPHFSKELHTCCTKLVDINLYVVLKGKNARIAHICRKNAVNPYIYSLLLWRHQKTKLNQLV